jgi:Protein of unknown function (DUF3617)
MTSRILLGAVALSVACAATAAERLNVKTGLWEITSVTSVSGMPPLPKEVLDHMTSEQRAELQASMKGDKPETNTDRECITDKDLEHPFESANTKECTETIVSSTRTTQEVRLVCSGEHKGTGLLRVSTPTPDTMTAMLDLRAGDGKDALTIKSQMKGRWLGADCGDEADDEEAPAENEDSSDA